MFRKIKRLLPLTLAVLMAVSPVNASGQDLIDPEELVQQPVTYETQQVSLGSFAKENSSPAEVYYPLQYPLSLTEKDGIFGEFTVKEGQTVKKGDILARFATQTSAVTLTQLEREIAVLEAETALGIAQRTEAIETLENTPAEGLEQEKNSILLKKQKVELAQYQYLQNRSIEQRKQAKQELQGKLDGYVLRAPQDGKVSDFAQINAGDPVTAGKPLMTFIRTDVLLLQVNNSSGQLRYNMPVKITAGRKNDIATFTGYVVASDGAIPQDFRTGYAYVRVDPESADAELINPRVTAESIRLDNVPVVARSAVKLENGKYYVLKFADGMIQKRYVDFGANNLTDVWLVGGVAAGDALIVD